jgi:hypothetical protein
MKKALLMGINRYRIPRSDLKGCVNDIKTMLSILTEKFGFDIKNITTLTDFQCTTKDMKFNIEKICYDVKPEDVIYIQYSGHGSSIVDIDKDEADGVDEIIIPTDIDWKKNIITDDYLYSVFSKVNPQTELVFHSDSCHSGSLLRVAPGHYLSPRYLNPPIEILEKIAKIKSQIYDNDAQMAQLASNQKKEDFNKRNGILLSGCSSTETSADSIMDNKYQGAFTFALANILKNNNYDITYFDLINKTNILLQKLGYSQHPQLEAKDELLNMKFLRGPVKK